MAKTSKKTTAASKATTEEITTKEVVVKRTKKPANLLEIAEEDLTYTQQMHLHFYENAKKYNDQLLKHL